jgi:hypothetical protein
MTIFNPIIAVLQWLNDTQLAQSIRDSVWLFPAIETIHVIAIVIVVGAITRLDLRLAGLVWRDRPVTDVSGEMLPWTWISFVVATIFGLLLFASKPLTYLGIAFFDVKMALIILAGANMLFFQYVTFRRVAEWDREPIPSAAVRIAGSLSLAFWVSVVVCGRLIGFV